MHAFETQQHYQSPDVEQAAHPTIHCNSSHTFSRSLNLHIRTVASLIAFRLNVHVPKSPQQGNSVQWPSLPQTQIDPSGASFVHGFAVAIELQHLSVESHQLQSK